MADFVQGNDAADGGDAAASREVRPGRILDGPAGGIQHPVNLVSGLLLRCWHGPGPRHTLFQTISHKMKNADLRMKIGAAFRSCSKIIWPLDLPCLRALRRVAILSYHKHPLRSTPTHGIVLAWGPGRRPKDGLHLRGDLPGDLRGNMCTSLCRLAHHDLGNATKGVTGHTPAPSGSG